MSKQKVHITELALRDSHQSLLATRMRTEDMMPIAEKLDSAGFWSVEMWGGATFDSCIRFLNEDPWERVRILKKLMPKTPFQMLLRGQNLIGYRHYADDLVNRFVELSASAGIDVFRVFDALNDIRNLKTSIEAVKRVGKHAEGTISYTVSPVHTTKAFVEMATELEKMGSDTICIKDMAGLLAPQAAFELISEIKAKVNVPLHLHSHCTSGYANFMYMKAIDAGIDILDCSISSLSQGSAHPPTETVVAMLEGTGHETGVNLDCAIEIGKYFADVRKKYKKYESSFTGVDVNILKSQIPGGMISNLESQLKQQGSIDKLDEVLLEVPRVRKDLGYPPLVTPTSQIVGTQAVLNVITGERYKMISKESQEVLRGNYGKLPGVADKELQAKVLDGAELTTCRPADNIEQELEALRKKFPDRNDEDLMVHALFPQLSESYYKNRGTLPEDFFDEEPDEMTTKTSEPTGSGVYTVNVDGKTYNVTIQEGSTSGATALSIPAPTPMPKPATGESSGGTPLTAPLPGTIFKILKNEGDAVEEGDVIMVMEAMKMENDIVSHTNGTIAQVLVSTGDSVTTGQTLAIIA